MKASHEYLILGGLGVVTLATLVVVIKIGRGLENAQKKVEDISSAGAGLVDSFSRLFGGK